MCLSDDLARLFPAETCNVTWPSGCSFSMWRFLCTTRKLRPTASSRAFVDRNLSRIGVSKFTFQTSGLCRQSLSMFANIETMQQPVCPFSTLSLLLPQISSHVYLQDSIKAKRRPMPLIEYYAWLAKCANDKEPEHDDAGIEKSRNRKRSFACVSYDHFGRLCRHQTVTRRCPNSMR